MRINLTPFIVFGVVLVLGVLALIIWRRKIAGQEDETIHVLEDAAVIPQQIAIAKKLEVIDKWGKLLTGVAAVYLVLVGALYLVQEWYRGTAAGM